MRTREGRKFPRIRQLGGLPSGSENHVPLLAAARATPSVGSGAVARRRRPIFATAFFLRSPTRCRYEPRAEFHPSLPVFRDEFAALADPEGFLTTGRPFGGSIRLPGCSALSRFSLACRLRSAGTQLRESRTAVSGTAPSNNLCGRERDEGFCVDGDGRPREADPVREGADRPRGSRGRCECSLQGRWSKHGNRFAESANRARSSARSLTKMALPKACDPPPFTINTCRRRTRT